MRNNIFAVPLFEMECNYKEDLDSHIYSHIEEVKSTLSNDDGEKFNSDLHGYTSYYGPNLIDLKPFQPLLNEIEGQVTKEMNTDISVQNAWFTIYEQDQFIQRHSHPITEWSGVYYYKVEENCGDLVFYDPIGSFRNHFTGKYPFKYTVKPTNGLLLAFPAWLEHESLPNKSGSDRIIFSYNFFARNAI